MRVTPPPSASPATTRWAGRTPSAAVGALEEAHLAAIAACGCDDEEDEEDLLAELGVGAAMLVVALAAMSIVFVPVVTAQTGSCDDALPPELVGNYSGLACSPVWNNFVLRYAQGGDNMLRVVLSAMYSSGWVGMSFSKDGLMVGSSAMVGWVGKTGQPTSGSSPSTARRPPWSSPTGASSSPTTATTPSSSSRPRSTSPSSSSSNPSSSSSSVLSGMRFVLPAMVCF